MDHETFNVLLKENSAFFVFSNLLKLKVFDYLYEAIKFFELKQ